MARLSLALTPHSPSPASTPRGARHCGSIPSLSALSLCGLPRLLLTATLPFPPFPSSSSSPPSPVSLTLCIARTHAHTAPAPHTAHCSAHRCTLHATTISQLILIHLLPIYTHSHLTTTLDTHYTHTHTLSPLTPVATSPSFTHQHKASSTYTLRPSPPHHKSHLIFDKRPPFEKTAAMSNVRVNLEIFPPSDLPSFDTADFPQAQFLREYRLVVVGGGGAYTLYSTAEAVDGESGERSQAQQHSRARSAVPP